MSEKPTHKELRQKIEELENEVAKFKNIDMEFRAIFYNSTDMIFMINKDYRVTSVNMQGSRFLNKKPEQVIGKSIHQLFNQEISNKYLNSLQKVFSSGDSARHNSRIAVKNREYWISTQLSPIKDEKAAVSAVIGVSRDITERKQWEEKLKDSEEKYRILVEQSLEGIVIVVGPPPKMVFTNSCFARIFGYTNNELLAMSPQELYGLVHPGDREMFFGRFAERLAGGHPPLRYEVRGITKDKKMVWLEISSSLIQYQGKPAVQGAFTDITERKRVEEDVKKLLAVVEQTTDGIAIADCQGTMLFANEAWKTMHGYESNEGFLGQNLKIFHNKQQLLKEVIPFNEKVMEKGFHTGEVYHIRKDGSPFPTHMSTTLLKDEEGKPYAIAGIARDITKKKQMEKEFKRNEEQLYQSQKLEGIGRLGVGIAHDLNNILTAIIGNTELAFKGLEKSKDIRDNLNQVMLSGRKASELITKILAFSRKQIIYPETIDVNNTILNLFKILHRVISEDIKITLNLSSTIFPVRADPTQIEQILMNLVINAQDAIKQKKKQETGEVITIETDEVFLGKEYISSHVDSTIGQHVLISVSDSGIGMDNKIINKIFEPFFTTKKIGEGTGLGLSTVYGIVKQNNGSIYVYSEPGEGSTFKIYWPAFTDKTQLKEEVKGEKVRGGSETILFVEDDDKVRKATEQLLALYGYKVFSASNGRFALDLVQNKNIKFDVLVTDVVMPEMGGIQLSEKLKEINPSLKVLFCSGYSDNHIINANGILKEDVSFIPKPYSSEKLAKKIREVLDKK